MRYQDRKETEAINNIIGERCQYNEYDAEVIDIENGIVYVELFDAEYEGQTAEFLYKPSDWF